MTFPDDALPSAGVRANHLATPTHHQANALDEASAEQHGRDDRNAGRPGFPFANEAIRAECEGAAVGTKTHLLQAYSRGWHQENSRIAEQELIDQGFYGGLGQTQKSHPQTDA